MREMPPGKLTAEAILKAAAHREFVGRMLRAHEEAKHKGLRAASEKTDIVFYCLIAATLAFGAYLFWAAVR